MLSPEINLEYGSRGLITELGSGDTTKEVHEHVVRQFFVR
jgi:hypothetical protein